MSRAYAVSRAFVAVSLKEKGRLALEQGTSGPEVRIMMAYQLHVETGYVWLVKVIG